MTREEAIAYFKKNNENLVSIAKDENVYNYEEQAIEADCMRETFEANVKAIEALEQEPRKGQWIEEDVFDGDVAYRCSECNELFWLESGTPKDNEYNFCPKCGAKMESEDKE